MIDREEVTGTFPEGAWRIELVAIYEVCDIRIATTWFINGARSLDAKS